MVLIQVFECFYRIMIVVLGIANTIINYDLLLAGRAKISFLIVLRDNQFPTEVQAVMRGRYPPPIGEPVTLSRAVLTQHQAMISISFPIKALVIMRKIHPMEGLAILKKIVILMELTLAHTITIIIHFLTEDQNIVRVPLPPLTGALVVVIINSLLSNLLTSKVVGVIIAFLNM